MIDHHSIKFWVAGHITAFFYISDQELEVLQKGSFGAGFNIDKGIVTEVSISQSEKTEIYFNSLKQEHINISVSESILKLIQDQSDKILPNLNINHCFQIPNSSGFGASAAGALGLAFAINKLLQLELEEKSLWQIAHKAEIINKSGLGDILGLFSNSSFELRLKPGAPGIGEVKSLNLNADMYDLFTISKGTLSTKNVLTDLEYRNKIIKYGKLTVEKFKLDPSFKSFMKLSEKFTTDINLLSEELKNLQKILNIDYYASQIMLGNSLFVFVPKTKIKQFLQSNSSHSFTKRNLTRNTIKEII